MDVAIRDLKAKLSGYLKRASAGELITVTDRGRPIAVLGPALNVVDLDAAVEAGWVTPASATWPAPRAPVPVEVDRRAGSGRGSCRVTSYADSSALLKRYVDEPDSDLADELLAARPRTRHGPSHDRRGAPQPRPPVVWLGAQRQPGRLRRRPRVHSPSSSSTQPPASSPPPSPSRPALARSTPSTSVRRDASAPPSRSSPSTCDKAQIARTLGFRVAGR